MSKIQKAKKHLSENKKLYIVGGVCLATGVAITVVVMKSPEIQQGVSQVNILSPRSKVDVVQIALPERSTPSKRIQDLATGTAYASVSEAARVLDKSRSYIQDRLKDGAFAVIPS